MNLQLSKTAGTLLLSGLLVLSAMAQNASSTVRGGEVKGATVPSGASGDFSVRGGSVTGGSAVAGNVTAGKVSPGTATVTVNGRELSAKAEGSVNISSSNGVATVQMGSHEVRVEGDRLLLNGQEAAAVPRGAQKLELKLSGGVLKVRADGVELLKKRVE